MRAPSAVEKPARSVSAKAGQNWARERVLMDVGSFGRGSAKGMIQKSDREGDKIRFGIYNLER